MTLGRYFLWALCCLLAIVVVNAIQLPVRKRCGAAVRILIFILKAVAVVGIALSIVAFQSWAAWHAGLLFAALYAALLGDAASDILTIPFVARRKEKKYIKLHMIVSAVCALLIVVFGTINMETVLPEPLDRQSDKLHNTYKAVFLADMHVGSSQSMATTERTIRKAFAENPDFILLGGDITDELSTKEEMEKTYEIFGESKVPVYFIYGNHDRQPGSFRVGGRTYSDEDLKAALDKHGIHVLEDEWVELGDDLILMGRDDVSTGVDREDLSKIPARPEGKYVLLLDHSPYETKDTEASGADLQLSGHTHAGQLFPLQILYDCLGYDAYGSYYHGDTETYVNPGTSGWYYPLRTEVGCRYNVITLEPKAAE